MKDFNEENNTFISISDLMSGLMIIFMFIGIAFMINVKKQAEELNRQKEYIQNIVFLYQNSKRFLNLQLHKEFDKDLKKWNAEITKDNIVRFYIEFETGKSEVPNKFKIILNDFFPRYIKVIKHFKKDIKELRVEGHTSKVWSSAKTKEEVYINNLVLSQQRAKNVLIYCYKIDNPKVIKNRKFLEAKFIANGMAYSHPIRINYKINWNKSRRVEFRVITKADEKIEKIIKTIK